MTSRQTVELFHLLFIRALFAGLGDKSLIAIKGGVNLQFYFQSVRFSEDLELDVTMGKGTLTKRVDGLLKSPSLLAPLSARGIRLGDVPKPKQTDTVQRWKLSVKSSSSALEERTKIVPMHRPSSTPPPPTGSRRRPRTQPRSTMMHSSPSSSHTSSRSRRCCSLRANRGSRCSRTS